MNEASHGRVAGKVVLITGGARNQGLNHGRLLAREGARVVLADVTDEAGVPAARELATLGLAVHYTHLDVARPDDWRTAIDDIVRREGRLDVLVNNAAILGTSALAARSLERNQVLAVNQSGVFGIQQAAPAMGARRSIINISSVIGNLGTEFNFAYWSASTPQMITRRGGEPGAVIRVNTIVPGGTTPTCCAPCPRMSAASACHHPFTAPGA